MKLDPYPEYKDSGVEWLGHVPKHWDVRKTRWVCEIKKRIAGMTGFDILSITQKGIRVKDTESNEGQISMDYSKYQLVEVGDFAMNHMDLLTGYIDVSKNIGVTSPDYRVFSVRDTSVIESQFILRIFQMGYHDKILYSMGQGSSHLGRWRLSTEEFNDFPLPLPPLPEQTAIAAYLDTETAKIDALMREQDELIALLKEKRQALISHCVTKGLDPSAPLKDSGIKWLGMVPEHWEVKKFTHIARIAEGQVDPEIEPYASMWLIAPNHIESGTGRLIELETSSNQGAISGKYYCSKGNVIYSKIRPALAKATIAPESCLCSADMYPLYPINFSNKFLLWILISPSFTTWATLESERVAMPKINRESLTALLVQVPPLPEQIAIAAYLDAETAKIDALIAEAEGMIERMQEHRSSLISHVVTGKVRV